MKVFVVLCTVFFSATALAQQAKDPVSDVLREMLKGRQKNTVAAFEEMPADKFDYKPTPEQMTFGHLAAHIVDGPQISAIAVGLLQVISKDFFELYVAAALAVDGFGPRHEPFVQLGPGPLEQAPVGGVLDDGVPESIEVLV